MTTKRELCPCGFPQSHPIPHEHDRTKREQRIIEYYERKLGSYSDLYEALKALVDHFRCNDENYYKSDLCTDALSALAKAKKI